MKKLTILVTVMLFTMLSLRADEQVREVQQSLKDQGFYYGEVDGQNGTETGAAIRRYQIRNGLEVTGQIDQQTLDALKIGSTPSSQEPEPAPAPQPPPPAPNNAPNLREPAREAVDSDREFLRKQPPGVDAPPQVGAPDYSSIFRKTPYENAPREVQVGTLRRAQSRLHREGFYDGVADGVPGPATGRAILRYQEDADLKPTGRLDMNTLADMNLLPGRGPVRYYPPPPPPSRRVYRGIWIQ